MAATRIAIAGLGNCASSLVQGMTYYASRDLQDVAGLMHPDIGGYSPADLQVVAAFDVDPRLFLDPAVHEHPNDGRLHYWLGKALAALRTWPEDVRLSFNLSAQDIASPASVAPDCSRAPLPPRPPCCW